MLKNNNPKYVLIEFCASIRRLPSQGPKHLHIARNPAPHCLPGFLPTLALAPAPTALNNKCHALVGSSSN